ncbi:PIN domain-containing protein [Desulfobaculum bizertense]|uniref:PIN domain-containing protein n=1 Tax=Desulfobaculum bizertense TaxID=376490 RepID=UPI001F3553DC|nr:PIN domain-containing protein [Desulfobaculum bizertense]UIJ39213.1 PIN domain-containing protein [Desulfobaculum bizertense]
MSLAYGAVVLDTSIYEKYNYEFYSGVLKMMQQFKNSGVDFLIPYIVKKEVVDHLSNKVKKAADSALFLSKYWKNVCGVPQSGDLKGSESLFEDDYLEQADRIFESYAQDCGALSFECDGYCKIRDVFEAYFENGYPFSVKKKSEFPDAVVLFSLVEYAKNNDVNIIVVSRDNDWKTFCEDKEQLKFLDDLRCALSLFNSQDERVIEKLNNSFGEESEFYGKLYRKIEDELSVICLDIQIDGPSRIENLGQHLILNNFNFDDEDTKITDINKKEKSVSYSLYGEAMITVACDVGFYTHDYIDDDDVSLGGRTLEVEIKSPVVFDVESICEFETGGISLNIENLSVDIDLPGEIDFGYVSPYEDYYSESEYGVEE